MAAPELRHDLEKLSAAIFYKPDFDWSNNAVSSMNYKFVCVEVGLPGNNPALELQAMETVIAPNTPGRPSKAQERQKVIQGLLDDGVDFDAVSRKDACDIVRRYAKKKFNANIESGYDNQTIQPQLVRVLGKRK